MSNTEVEKLTQLVMNIVKVLAFGITILVMILSTLYAKVDSISSLIGRVDMLEESFKYSIDRLDRSIHDQDKIIYGLDRRVYLLEGEGGK